MLEIWGRRSSSNVQALMWCVGELQLPHVRYDAGGQHGVTDTEFFLALNPNGTIPVIRDAGGPPIWETGVVLRYLATRYGSDPFWPNDPDRRTEVDMWAEWAKINVAMCFTVPVFWRVVRTPETERDKKAITFALRALHERLAIAEARLEKAEWLAGPSLTLADIQLGHVLFRYFDIDIERPDWPRLNDYYDRLMMRPAFREHVAISYDELRATPL